MRRCYLEVVGYIRWRAEDKNGLLSPHLRYPSSLDFLTCRLPTSSPYIKTFGKMIASHWITVAFAALATARAVAPRTPPSQDEVAERSAPENDKRTPQWCYQQPGGIFCVS
jgi:hypothetical protein